MTIAPEATLEEARQKMLQADIGGLVVTDPEGTLLGIITTRDVLLAPDPEASVEQAMTPRERLVVASVDEPLSVSKQKLYQLRI
jgi:IMP dehydrogenase